MKEERFREIYHQYYRLVKKTVYSVLRDVDLSEDICQEVFILFSEKADALDEAYVKQWFVVNAKRKAIDFCRKSYQVHETTAASCEEGEILPETAVFWTSCGYNAQNSIEDEITHKLALRELTGKLFEDLARKNLDWYEIVIKMNIEGKGAEETARALGISIENLRAKRHRLKVWINKNYREKFRNL